MLVKKMNNILLRDELSSFKSLDIESKLVIEDKAIINSINYEKDLDLDITINKDAILVLNIFNKCKNRKTNINITLNDNSKLYLSCSFITDGVYDLNINTNLVGNETNSNVYVRGINEGNNDVKIKMDGMISKDSKDNTLNEYAKVINKESGNIIIVPNLLVDSCDVEANHGAAICKIEDDELLYLESKGISKDKANKLLEDSFILSIFDDDFKEKIKEFL